MYGTMDFVHEAVAALVEGVVEANGPQQTAPPVSDNLDRVQGLVPEVLC